MKIFWKSIWLFIVLPALAVRAAAPNAELTPGTISKAILALASVSAVWRPMPELAPVMIAVFPERGPFLSLPDPCVRAIVISFRF